jgi:hypothetical protein
MNDLYKIVCSPVQAGKLVDLGIFPRSILWQRLEGHNGETFSWKVQTLIKPILSPECVPAWTKAEIDAMIGPRFAKADLWPDEKIREKSATDPNQYPVFFLDRVEVFDNGAQASAAGLIWLIQNEFIRPDQANERYRAIFLKS